MKKFPILYKRANTGKVVQWQMIVDDDGFYSISGDVGGKLTTTKPSKCIVKNEGKTNETTAEEQALKEAQAKHDFKLAHGYTLDKEATDDTTYLEPMLCKQYEDYKDKIVGYMYVDKKLNGIRMNAIQGTVKSRKGKIFHTIPHIKNALAPLFEKYPDLFLDGECFTDKLKNHLNRLVELVSVAYKEKDLTPELLKESEEMVQFWVYDGYNFQNIKASTPFIERREALKKLLKDIKYVHVLDYIICKNDTEVQTQLKKSRDNNDEGIIIRHSNCEYEHKRSKFLLKAKNFNDSEYKILDIESGTGNWDGFAKRVILELPKTVIGRDGKEQTSFASNIEGNQEYLKKLLENKQDAIGKMATVRYLELSEFGIPQIPYVITIRGYE